jgi:hypothetical protein
MGLAALQVPVPRYRRALNPHRIGAQIVEERFDLAKITMNYGDRITVTVHLTLIVTSFTA